MGNFLIGLIAVIMVLGLVVVGSAIGGYIFMILWNAVIAAVFGAPSLTFYQSWALWFLIGSVAGLFRSQSSSK